MLSSVHVDIPARNTQPRGSESTQEGWGRVTAFRMRRTWPMQTCLSARKGHALEESDDGPLGSKVGSELEVEVGAAKPACAISLQNRVCRRIP